MADRATGSRVTLADVARAAGVSVPLVSIVMRNAPGASPASRERVLAVAAELGYRPDQRARLLRLQRSRLLGVCFGVEHAFHGDLLDAIYRAADARGYDVVLSGVTPNRGEERAVETLLADRCEALLLLGSQLSPARLTRLSSSMPVVVVARRLRNADVDAVHTADAMGAAMAVEHLVGLGHRRIAHVDGGRAPGATDRRNGYRSAMRRYGMADEILIVSGGLGEDDGTRATRELLAVATPTGIIAFNDRCAVGVLDALRRARLAVPTDVSVVGFDDSRLARLATVDLTTVGQDAVGLGRLAVERAIDRLDPDFSAPTDVEVVPHLVVRSTTAAAPKGTR
jgi:DNA-binding LacI/PurR family transcriptional regulator